MTTIKNSSIVQLIKLAFTSENQDFTTGSIKKAVVLLAIPMIMEMMMESLFSIVDIFFVSKLGKTAVAAVGLTESMLTIIYAIGVGISMASTAIVARRVGEKNNRDASIAGAQSITMGLAVSILVSIIGILYVEQLLDFMGASAEVIATGKRYTQILLGSNIVIMLLFIINGVFRGAGNAAIAFKSLAIANGCNILLCPIFINLFGLTGAALATLCGRTTGVLYQLYNLNKKEGILQIHWEDYKPNWVQIKAIIAIAWTATLQFVIASGSWIFLVRLISNYGDAAVAAYTVAIRVMLFFLMPAWGLSNAAATLVGQNLGAQQPDRAEKSVWQTAKYSCFFMLGVTLFFLLFAPYVIDIFSDEDTIIATGAYALRVMSIGFVFYGIGMVIINAFNGAGDSKTPTIMNFFIYWCFQIPLAWLLSHQFGLGKNGIFIAIVIAETVSTLVGITVFKRGKWKLMQV